MKYYFSRYIINLSGLLAVFATTIVNAATPITSINFAIEPKFDAAENFPEGLAKVRIGGKYGYIRIN
jgi:WG containing repeat